MSYVIHIKLVTRNISKPNDPEQIPTQCIKYIGMTYLLNTVYTFLNIYSIVQKY